MSIKPTQGNGVPRAIAVCDSCGREEFVACDYERKANAWIPNEGQINRKLLGLGWSLVKGHHFCIFCEAKRKADASAPKETAMTAQKTNVAPIRQPTPEQEVDIIVALSSVYDRKAKRYQGQETDKTVAEAVGGGVMPGWVAAIRDAKFGPAGNEEMALIREEIRRLKADHDTMIDGIRRDLDKAIERLSKRIDACVVAHDRRVG